MDCDWDFQLKNPGLASSELTNGVARTGQRALLYATGMDEEDMKKPFVAVINSFSEMVPGHMHMRELAEQVKYGILETNGRLSVLPYAEQRPATARQLGLESRETGLPVVIISDGRILQDNLKRRGLDLSWLDKQLAEHGYPDFRDVFLLTMDEAGGVYFVPREGK